MFRTLETRLVACRMIATMTVLCGLVDIGIAQTRLHRDLGGVSLQLDRIHLSVRRSGRVTTSIPSGNGWYYQSNYGFGGLTYDSPNGRLDSLYNVENARTFAWYTSQPPSRAPNLIDWRLQRIRPDKEFWRPPEPAVGPSHRPVRRLNYPQP